jgi:hypothetical protein
VIFLAAVGAMAVFGVISTSGMLLVLTCLNVGTLARVKALTRFFLLSVTLLCLQGLLADFHGVDANELFITQLASENVMPPKERPSNPVEDMSGTLVWRLLSVSFLNDPNDFGQTTIVVAPWILMRFSAATSWFVRLSERFPGLPCCGATR